MVVQGEDGLMQSEDDELARSRLIVWQLASSPALSVCGNVVQARVVFAVEFVWRPWQMTAFASMVQCRRQNLITLV